MATKPQIIEVACDIVGERARFREATGEARRGVTAAADRMYPQVRRRLLFGPSWSWNTKREELKRAPDDTGAALPYVFRIPEKAVQLRALYSSKNARQSETEGWTRRGDFLYAEFAEGWLEFQRNIAEEAWPELFVGCMEIGVAARIAYNATGDPELARGLRMELGDVVKEALRVDGQSKPGVRVQDFSYLDAHAGAYRPGLGRQRLRASDLAPDPRDG